MNPESVLPREARQSEACSLCCYSSAVSLSAAVAEGAGFGTQDSGKTLAEPIKEAPVLVWESVNPTTFGVVTADRTCDLEVAKQSKKGFKGARFQR